MPFSVSSDLGKSILGIENEKVSEQTGLHWRILLKTVLKADSVREQSWWTNRASCKFSSIIDFIFDWILKFNWIIKTFEVHVSLTDLNLKREGKRIYEFKLAVFLNYAGIRKDNQIKGCKLTRSVAIFKI